MTTTRIRLQCLLAITALFVAATGAGAADRQSIDDARFAACNATRDVFATTLVASASTAPHARAIWLDASTLRWPAAPAEATTFRLHAARSGLTFATPDAAPTNADRIIELTRRTSPLPADVAARFPHVVDGATLSLSNDARDDFATLLQGDLAVTAEDATGRVLGTTATQIAGALDDRYASAENSNDLGAAAWKKGTYFAVWAPTARAVTVCLYRADDGPVIRVLPLARNDATGIWSRGTQDDLRGHYYTYLVDVFVRGHGVVRQRVTDPYALSLSANSHRAYIANLGDPRLTPRGWRDAPRPEALAAPTDLVIYELHVRDFSIGDATVPAADRGKYRAFTAPRSDGMRHVRDLARAGITDIHLLPVFDLATIPERGCITPRVTGTPDGETQQAQIAATHAQDCFNWGYDPLHFTAPEGSYASNARDGATRIREFRAMVQALHAAGLRVGMDVVYNHTSASGQWARSVLDRIVPGYYQRLDADGVVATSTCCANTATEHAMMAKLMIDSAVVWARDYRIDSFRFDLMGHQPRAVMERLQRDVDRAAGRHIPLIGEGWNFGEIADGARFVQASQRSLNGSGIGTFSDRARDAVRGGSPGDDDARLVTQQGFVNGLAYARNGEADPARGDAALRHLAGLVRVGLAGTLSAYEMERADGAIVPASAIDYHGEPAGYADAPGEVVNYVENHDGLTLYDVNAYKLPIDTPMAERARVQVLALATVALSQGIAYFHAGGELLRSKSLDRNSYDSGDWFNRIDWRGRTSTFGSGLPPRADNGKAWPFAKPRLANAALVPDADTIDWTRRAFLDLLRIRASTPLFRLRSADEIRRRLRFWNTGPDAEPTLIAATLDGEVFDGSPFASVAYFVNVDTRAHDVVVTAARGRDYVLHPVHRAADAADKRPHDAARFTRDDGRFSIPPRTVVVYVIEQ